MLACKAVSVAIARPWDEVYERFYTPETFAKWASGLSQADLIQDGDVWRGHGPEGPITVQFTSYNAFGVMDHWVDTGAGAPVYIPLRIIANQEGAEVTLLVFQQPGMSDAKFKEDLDWVLRDLQKLKTLAEQTT